MSPEDFEALYHEYRDLVWGMIHRSGVAGPDRDDVFMETWEAVWRAADSFTGECRISTWIAGIARHKAIDSLRKRRALCLPDPDLARILDESDHPRFFPPPPLPPDAQAQSGELKDAIREALDSLTPLQSFSLGKRLEGFSYREIAERANISYKTVSNVSQTLRDKLSAQGFADLVVKAIRHFDRAADGI